ncbi:hypothetical protein CHS0354_029903 [Potamilus streckersoni]|uniref:Endonuclease/exonuclease/phosphatase domain-containing protein n=1 Tax=Potamilus streckersoni TaxID=2493646 RepID=A0AAE0VIN7_9BIVA|nr:hypothetical protein CHS0354_029903 [Potamilus streckersoni]
MKSEIYVLSCIFAVSAASSFTFSTYNLWNVMFNWNARKQRIAQMIKEHMPDVVALQEVRVKGSSGASQLIELKQILPHDYKWHIFHTANNVTLIKNSVLKEWSAEGIGIISRKPILESTTHQLSNDHGPDTNRRIILQAAVMMASSVIINVVVVHMSYDRQQQCNNAAELLKHITEHKLHNLVILGDFNTYVDFEWPVSMLTGEAGTRDKLNPCSKGLGILFPSLPTQIGRFKDAWTEIHNDRNVGFTFSNMPTPGYESRPDRILISSNFQVLDAVLSGNGSYYRQHFQGTIHYHRFVIIIESAFLSYMGYFGYPCLQDCGPHGSCRCGVCVKGGGWFSLEKAGCNPMDIFDHGKKK